MRILAFLIACLLVSLALAEPTPAVQPINGCYMKAEFNWGEDYVVYFDVQVNEASSELDVSWVGWESFTGQRDFPTVGLSKRVQYDWPTSMKAPTSPPSQ